MAARSAANGNQMIRFTCLPSFAAECSIMARVTASYKGRDFLERRVGHTPLDGANPSDSEAFARLGYASVMTTGVPSLTWWKSHSASGMCMRMQPCEAE